LAAALGEDKPAPFRYRHQGNLAVGLAHIYFSIGMRASILVAEQCFWAYLTFGRGARLITGLVPLFEDPKMQPASLAANP
jgi:NADH dehydrogenase